MKKSAKQLRKSLKLSKNLLRKLTREELKAVAGGTQTDNTCIGC